MSTAASKPPAIVSASLFSGVDEAINASFGIASYGRKYAFREVAGTLPASFDGIAFVERIFQIIASNWENCVLCQNRTPSAENWRWFKPRVNIDARNQSPEVTLERALIGACLELGRADWSNQVPLASGLVNSTSYKTKNIDLVHQRTPNAFDLVELKVASNNALFAAMEILQYGLIWLLSRRDRARLGYSGRPLVEAIDVRFVVLAPIAFFDGRDGQRIKSPLDRGLAKLGERFGVQLAFRFEALPAAFEWPNEYSAAELTAFLDDRKAL